MERKLNGLINLDHLKPIGEHPQITFVQMAEKVEEILSPETAAFIAFADPDLPPNEQNVDRSEYRRFVNGTCDPSKRIQARIKDAFEVISLLENSEEDPGVIKAWFNTPGRDYYSPIDRIIRDDSFGVRQDAVDFLDTDGDYWPI